MIESGDIRENLIVLARLRELKRRAFLMSTKNKIKSNNIEGSNSSSLQSKEEEKEQEVIDPIDPMVIQGMSLAVERHIPPAQVMSNPQGNRHMRESCALISLHAGFDKINTQALDILTDASIAFIKKLGSRIRLEIDRTARQNNPVSVVSKMDDIDNEGYPYVEDLRSLKSMNVPLDRERIEYRKMDMVRECTKTGSVQSTIHRPRTFRNDPRLKAYLAQRNQYFQLHKKNFEKVR